VEWKEEEEEEEEEEEKNEKEEKKKETFPIVRDFPSCSQYSRYLPPFRSLPLFKMPLNLLSDSSLLPYTLKISSLTPPFINFPGGRQISVCVYLAGKVSSEFFSFENFFRPPVPGSTGSSMTLYSLYLASPPPVFFTWRPHHH
jgi:hypothetical protein